MRSSSLEGIPDLWMAIRDLVSQVPMGRVTTYGEVARALGDVVASRFVGLVMSRNDDIVRVPCRRVVQSDGKLGGYTGGGPQKKGALLEAEGVRVEDGKVVDIDELLFTDFVSGHPLEELRARQKGLRRLAKVPKDEIDIDYVAGVDVAYSGEHAFAAAALFDYRSGEMTDYVVHEGDAAFPYVPTYLAFRELPLVLPLVKDLPKKTVLMYDGNGILHPEGMGIATHAGATFNMPAIGVAKRLLCGKRGQSRGAGVAEILLNGRVVGYELVGAGRSKPVYVSVGAGIGQRQTLDVVGKFSKHRIPEPTRAAHIIAERARRGTSHK